MKWDGLMVEKFRPVLGPEGDFKISGKIEF